MVLPIARPVTILDYDEFRPYIEAIPFAPGPQLATTVKTVEDLVSLVEIRVGNYINQTKTGQVTAEQAETRNLILHYKVLLTGAIMACK